MRNNAAVLALIGLIWVVLVAMSFIWPPYETTSNSWKQQERIGNYE